VSFKILATADTHFNFDAQAINETNELRGQSRWFPECDVFVHAGDLMYHGTEGEWNGRVDSLATVDAPLKLYVPGNHDIFVELFTGPANQDLRTDAHVQMLGTHPKYFTHKLPNGMTVLGLPFVTDLPGWGFNRTEQDLDRMLDFMLEDIKHVDIVVTHSPPFGVLDGSHYGVKAWNFLQQVAKPEIWICGHIHENYGVLAKNGTTFYNVAMLDRSYKRKNPPMLIEVDE